MREDVLLEQIRTEEGRVIGIKRNHQPLFEVAANGMGIEGEAAAGSEVGGDIELEWDLALGEDLDKVGILFCGERMADSLGADVQRRPDALRADRFASVAGETETGGAGISVDLAELIGGTAGLVAADADADDAGVLLAELGCLGEDAGALLDAESGGRRR
jgi:hypothetical protein